MNILINEQLKKLRREKGNTQDELATHLGITVQAISKWERGEGYPDITLLPYIASYYNVSVDLLLGVDEIAKEKKIEEYLEKNHELFTQGKCKERVVLMREAQKEFPNDMRIIDGLMYTLSAADNKGNADEIIDLAQRILNDSTADKSHRDGAIQCLTYTYYYAKKDVESAKKYARMASDGVVTVYDLMPRLLDGDEAVRYCQENIQWLFEKLQIYAHLMVSKGKYPPQDAVKVFQFLIDCFNLLYSDDDMHFYHCRVAEAYESMARRYSELGDTEKMFCCLEKSAEHNIKFDTRTNGAHTSFMVNKVIADSSNDVKDFEGNTCGEMLKELNGKHFAKFKDDERMTAIIEKLKTVAVL